MILSDIPAYLYAAGLVGTALLSGFVILGRTIKKTTKTGSAILTNLATKGVDQIVEGVSILTKIDIKVDHIDQRMREVKSEMVEVQKFMNISARDSTQLHMKLDEHGRRIATLEGREG